jgi:pimeloyl-ACP methyl ester carboxylesterase
MKRPIWKSIFKWAGISILTLLSVMILFMCTVRGITYFSNHIDTPNSVDEGIYVPLGGQEQYLLIRGEDTANPVMIWLHGGPSSPDAFVNFTFQKYLTHEYTVVNWDQRGCGRTYYRNKDADPANATASFEQAQADLDELVNYLTERFHTDKVIIVGHSYGTMLGSKYVLEHSDKVAAYIGVGQVVTMESDIYSYEHALEMARSAGDDTSALEEAYTRLTEDMTLVNMMNLRSHVSKYHSAEKEANTLWFGVISPYMGFDDLRWFLRQMGDFQEYIKQNQQLFDSIMVADVRQYGMDYQVPVGFISGSDDWTTPVKYSEEYYNAVSAPIKDFATINGCGHSPQYDSPEEFCSELNRMLNEFIEE